MRNTIIRLAIGISLAMGASAVSAKELTPEQTIRGITATFARQANVPVEVMATRMANKIESGKMYHETVGAPMAVRILRKISADPKNFGK